MSKVNIVFNNKEESALLAVIADLKNQLSKEQEKFRQAVEQILHYQTMAENWKNLYVESQHSAKQIEVI